MSRLARSVTAGLLAGTMMLVGEGSAGAEIPNLSVGAPVCETAGHPFVEIPYSNLGDAALQLTINATKKNGEPVVNHEGNNVTLAGHGSDGLRFSQGVMVGGKVVFTQTSNTANKTTLDNVCGAPAVSRGPAPSDGAPQLEAPTAGAGTQGGAIPSTGESSPTTETPAVVTSAKSAVAAIPAASAAIPRSGLLTFTGLIGRIL